LIDSLFATEGQRAQRKDGKDFWNHGLHGFSRIWGFGGCREIGDNVGMKKVPRALTLDIPYIEPAENLEIFEKLRMKP